MGVSFVNGVPPFLPTRNDSQAFVSGEVGSSLVRKGSTKRSYDGLSASIGDMSAMLQVRKSSIIPNDVSE